MKNSLLVFLLLFSFVRGYGQCTLNVNLSASNTAICSGTGVVLTATPSAGTAPYTYAWSTGETTPTISVNKAGTYKVSVADKTTGCQPVTQSITISTSPVPTAPTAQSVVVCQNNPATLTATGPGGNYQWYDAATGGNFLASGATYTTPPISAHSTFYVQTTMGGCTSLRTPVDVFIPGLPSFVGATVCAGDVATLSASGASTFTWYDAPSGGNVVGTGSPFTTPLLFSTTTYYLVGTTNGCFSPRIPVVAKVTPAPQAPTASNAAVCSGSNVSLHATAPAGTIDWFDVPTGGTSLIASPDFTTPPLTTTTTYYVQTTLNTCSSSRTPVTVTVNPLPQTPAVQDVTICSGTSAVLTPTGPGGSYQWYNSLTGGTLLATATTFNTPVLSNSTTYYVQTNNGACISARVPVNVIVSQPPPPPSVTGPLICSGTSVTLTATAPGGAYQWYDAAMGGNLLATNASYATPALITATTYYVQTTVAGCVSSRTAVTVSILPLPSAPTASNATVCSGNSATLTAAGGNGNYEWYDAATGGNLLSSGQVYATPALTTTTTYYVQTISSIGCASARAAVTVTVNPLPAPPTASGTSICPGTPATLTASAAGGTIEWYNAASGGTLLGSGSTYTTPALSASTTYYVQNTSGLCSSPRTPVTVSVIALASPQFQYPSGTFCTSSTNPTPVINNPSGGTFSASPAGLVFISTTTGQINVGASAPGNYVISFANNGTCPGTTSANVAIVSTFNAQFSYSGPYCQDGPDPSAIFPAGASGGVFTASPAGLVFINVGNGQINLLATPAGTYTITNTIAASGSCPASVFSAPLTIGKRVIVNAGPNQIVPVGTPVQLAGSITGGTTTGTWSGGTGSFSNPSLLNAIYTPGAGETAVTLTLTSSTPPAPCGAKSGTVMITFNSAPPAPTVAGTSVCLGSSATLSATAPGGTYQWYDAPTAGTLLNTGPTYTTAALAANTTYYVQTTVGGITSSRTAVTVIVNITAAPVAPGTTICMGNSTTLTASGSAGSYEWFDAPSGGNLLSVNSSYVTSVLNANTSYYVQTAVNGCTSTRTKVDIIVNPVPHITSSSTGNICSGNALNYTITSDIAGTTFAWSRAAVPGISNPSVANQTTGTINETLINTGNAIVNVTYVITPTVNSCPGQPFNYVVTVYPMPIVTSAATAVICNETAHNYAITFNVAGLGFSWSRAVVPGISNPAVSGQTAPVIKEILSNTTNAPIDVTYIFYYGLGNCTGLSFKFVVTVNPSVSVTSAKIGSACSGTAQNYAITSNIPSATFSWSRSAVPNISNSAVIGQTSTTINETLINTGSTPVVVNYIITPMANACQGLPLTYSVTVYPQTPTPAANANSPVCVGSTINLQTPVIPNATYTWTGPNSFTSTSQNPSIASVTLANSGTYNLFITVNGCPSATSSVDVTVDPPPIANAGPDQVVCNNAAAVTLAGSVSGGTTTGVWSSNGTGTFSPSISTLTGQYNPSAQDIAAGSIKLTLSSTSKDDCSISTSVMTITFQTPMVTSAATGTICTSTAQNYVITANTPTATYSWSRAAVAGISNPAVVNQVSGTINETLINTTLAAVQVVYVITPSDKGCPGPPFTYTLTVNPQPAVPTITANTPVCVASTIHLQTPAIANATYSWTGPGGFASSSQNPDITNITTANSGTYNLVVLVNGCPSPAATVNVVVDEPPLAKAGPDQAACPAATGVQLAGSVTGGTTTGVWTTSGTGTFSPSNSTLSAQYIPSALDVSAGSVTLTLASTSADNCVISTSSMTITFKLLSAVTAGPAQSICSQDAAKLNGQISIPGGGIWSSSGTGTFNPSANQLNALYLPSAADIKNGSVTLTLTANNPGQCYIPTDATVLTFIPPPTVNAGGTRYVLKGYKITLEPTVSDNNVQYSWSPDIDISSTTIKNPVVTGNVDQIYTLTVTDVRGCVASAQISIKVSPEIVVPNAFTPNGDGVNDQWNVKGLVAYQNAVVDIFDRYGQKVFHSKGYGQPWDGTISGKGLPFGTYYYIIDTKMNGIILSGYVAIIK